MSSLVLTQFTNMGLATQSTVPNVLPWISKAPALVLRIGRVNSPHDSTVQHFN